MSTRTDPTSDSYPLAAQLPLPTFTLPNFPPEASRLRALTLTSDIKLDEYQSLVSEDNRSTTNPLALPQSITDLTLELFTLGFPPTFLTSLSKALPHLQSLTLFSCLIDGLGDGSRADAVTFFESLPNLRQIHVIDTFARPGFWSQAGKAMEKLAKAPSGSTQGNGNEKGLKMVEISFTYRGHEEEDFLTRIGGEELASLLVPGVVGWSAMFLSPTPPSATEGEAENGTNGEQEKAPKGILPFASDGRASAAVRKRFTEFKGELAEMRMLNLGMYTLRTTEVGDAVACCVDTTTDKTRLLDLTVSVLMEEGWFEGLLGHLSGKCPNLEALEVIGVPNVKDQSEQDQKAPATGQQGGGATNLVRQSLPALKRLHMNILKAQDIVSLDWDDQDGGKWRAV